MKRFAPDAIALLRSATVLFVGLFATALPTTPVAAQQFIGVGADYRGFSFDEGLGVDAAQLFMVPVSVRFPVGQSLTLDVYSAWAQGKVEQDDVEYTLSGPVDTRIKASFQATPWALLSVGLGLPTGNATHDGEEAVVAAVLATDLLGFQEATWGTGLSVTTSAATAVQAGQFGIGFAGAYAVRSEFEPRAEQDLVYQPGNETRFRVGIDRNFGNSTLTAGGTFMMYEQDQANGLNLFQAGNRMQFDASYAFRAGAGVWTVYATDLWREHGDLTFDIIDAQNVVVGDTTIVTPSQNLLVAGVVGAIGIGSYQFRPMIDFKSQSREAADGSDEGSGWMMGAGGDFPVRLFGAYDVFPKARVLWGSITDPTGVGRNVLGGVFSATIRWSF